MAVCQCFEFGCGVNRVDCSSTILFSRSLAVVHADIVHDKTKKKLEQQWDHNGLGLN